MTINENHLIDKPVNQCGGFQVPCRAFQIPLLAPCFCSRLLAWVDFLSRQIGFCQTVECGNSEQFSEEDGGDRVMTHQPLLSDQAGCFQFYIFAFATLFRWVQCFSLSLQVRVEFSASTIFRSQACYESQVMLRTSLQMLHVLRKALIKSP